MPPHLIRRARSDLETLFLDICALYRLPPPEVNVKLGRWEVHARDLDLHTTGYTVLRFTDRQLENEVERVASVVIEELAS